MTRKSYALFVFLPTAFLVFACGEQKPPLRAYQVKSTDELIGGPSAKGKVGDFVIENSKIRALIGNVGPGWAAGIFGGTLLDVDRYRSLPEFQNGRGLDSFSEAFPLANLLVPNPLDPRRTIVLPAKGNDQIKVDTTTSFIGVLKDGSDGEAIIRVEGHTAYMFDMLKFLNRDVLDGFLKGLNISGIGVDQLADLLENFLGINLFGMLNRLQISFDFRTDYILHQDEDYLTIETTVWLSPQSEELLGGCAPVVCDKKCENGYVFQEVEEEREGGSAKYKRMCPVCECVSKVKEMPTFNEPYDFFKVILGGIKDWQNPTWRGGIVAGDFLFYGSEAKAFAPGVGFDIERKIFEDLWQGVGTLGSPLAYDYFAGVADNVSYIWTTDNPNKKHPIECEKLRIALVKIQPQNEEEVVKILREKYGIGDAKSRVRALVVDGRPIVLREVENTAPKPSEHARVDEKDRAFEQYKEQLLHSTEVQAIQNDLGMGAVLDVIPMHRCMPSKVLVPLYSTSATAVLTHFSEGDRLEEEEGKLYDKSRVYKYRRYLVVGDGDVGSALRTVYKLRGEPHGEVEGVVVEEGSLEPIFHAHVFALKWIEPCTQYGIKTYADYEACAKRRLTDYGFVSHMMTDVGIDLDPDGRFSGPLPPGKYYLFAHTYERGSSELVTVEIVEGETSSVAMTLPKYGIVDYFVTDEAMNLGPAKLAFIPVDYKGVRLDWQGRARPEIGDPLYDHGIYLLEHSEDGSGSVRLPPGRYDIVVSRGVEYSVSNIKGFEVKAGLRTPLNVALVREVNTSGYIAGDFHVHARNSVDSALPLDLRVKAAVAEGLEAFSSSDHDHLTDYWPHVLSLDLERYLLTAIGVETSPLEWGHYNGYPLKYDARKMAVHDPPQWQGKTLPEVWQEMRKRASVPEDSFILQVNHPRDGFMGYMSQGGVRPYDLERSPSSLEMCNRAIQVLPCDFDAFEVLNGKHAEYLHTPTIVEAHLYNKCFKEISSAKTMAEMKKVCPYLQDDPVPECQGLMKPQGEQLSDDEANIRILYDHCQWHKDFRETVERCGKEYLDLISCKRAVLEALKALSVRYMLERTIEEEKAFWQMTKESDVGCDISKAMMGCSPMPDQAGCGGDKCACEKCVCALHPECCKKAGEGGTGWIEVCADLCRNACGGCENKPCTSRFQPVEDFFALLNAGLIVTGVANSDSHTTLNEIGLPRNFIRVGADGVLGLDFEQVTRAIKAHRVVMSSGPFIDFRVTTDTGAVGEVGDVLTAKGASKILGYVRVETPSWFSVDRVEIYKDGRLYRRFFPNKGKEAIVDFEGSFEVDGLDKDFYLVVMAYGLDKDGLAPVYKRRPYGEILIQQVVALGAEQLLESYRPDLEYLWSNDLIRTALQNFANVKSVDDLVAMAGGAISGFSIQLPDSYNVIPWAMTNPVFVDVDGNGFWAVGAKDLDGNGMPDLPPFCSRPCEKTEDCGENQDCIAIDATNKFCGLPVPDTCPK